MKAVFKALASAGFWKAFLYSFGSFFIGWILTALAMPEVVATFGGAAWLVPAINSFLVLVKQTWDEKVKDWEASRQ